MHLCHMQISISISIIIRVGHPGLISLHAFWSPHLRRGRPRCLIPVEMYRYTNLGMCVSPVLNNCCVHLHVQLTVI